MGLSEPRKLPKRQIYGMLFWVFGSAKFRSKFSSGYLFGVVLIDFRDLYRNFQAPIADFDCGDRCAPYNERGVPFCCDLRHAVPAAYQEEWEYLEKNTDLWRPWIPENEEIAAELQAQTPPGQVLIACLGHLHCQRDFRSLTCRAFPFYPYVTLQGEFIGLSYYWQYEDRCWVINHLDAVSSQYRLAFMRVFDQLFEQMPEEKATYRYHAIVMRRVFGRKHRAIPLLHRNGKAYKLSPGNGRMRRCRLDQFPKFGPYRIAADLPFPDENSDNFSSPIWGEAQYP